MNEATRYGGFSVRTECNHCGNPLPLHGPLLNVTCPHCLQEAQVPASVWKTILEDFDEQHDSLAEGQGAVSATMVEALNVRHEHKKHVPSCEKCGAPFGVNQLPVGTDMNFACTQCGDPASTHPVPEWLRHLVPTARQFYSTEPRVERASALDLGSAEAIKPVAMACPACGGSLAATTESERVMTCRYCQTDVYLPDEVWRRLHPVATVKEWFIRFEGKTRAQLAADKRAKSAAKRARHEQEQNRRSAEKRRIAQQQAQAAREQRRLDQNREIGRMKALAYVASLFFVLALIAIGLVGWYEYHGDPTFAQSDEEASASTLTGQVYTHRAASLDPEVIIAMLGGTFLLLILALVFVARPIKKATGYDGDWMLFNTWFWMPFALAMPVVGQVMALIRSLILFRGKFGSSSITTNNTSTRSYDAVRLTRGEGRPAAIVFLALALLYPLAMASLFAPAKLDALLRGELTMEQLNSSAPMPQTGVRGLQPQNSK